MEIFDGCIKKVIHLLSHCLPIGRLQNRLMNLYKILGHLLTIGIFTAISYLLTSCIASGNIMGIVLAIVSLVATLMFLYLLPKLYQQPDNEEESA